MFALDAALELGTEEHPGCETAKMKFDFFSYLKKKPVRKKLDILVMHKIEKSLPNV